MKKWRLILCCLGAGGAAPDSPRLADTPGQAAYNTGNFSLAAEIWRQDAAQGDAAAEFGLGLIYDLGQGVPGDTARAYAWYLLAAERGNAQAQFNVGIMNDSGRGTMRDAPVAAIWYARAASQGLHRAAYDLGLMYEAGEGVTRNLDAASAWYAEAARDLPAARDRLRSLNAHRPKLPPLSSVIMPPVPIRLAASPVHELVWTAPPQPVQIGYFVTVMSLDGVQPVQVFAGSTRLSAIFIPALAGVKCFAWRVYAAGATAPHYAASPWQVEDGDGPRPSPGRPFARPRCAA